MQYKPIYGASGKFLTLCWSQVDLVSVPCNTNLCVEPVGKFVTLCWSQVDLVSVPCNTNLCVEPVGKFVTFCVGDKLI